MTVDELQEKYSAFNYDEIEDTYLWSRMMPWARTVHASDDPRALEATMPGWEERINGDRLAAAAENEIVEAQNRRRRCSDGEHERDETMEHDSLLQYTEEGIFKRMQYVCKNCRCQYVAK